LCVIKQFKIYVNKSENLKKKSYSSKDPIVKDKGRR